MARLSVDYVPLRGFCADDDVVGAVVFGDGRTDRQTGLSGLHISLAQLGPEPLVEVWRGDGGRFLTAASDVACLECGTRGAYESLFRAAGDWHLIRVWNHIARLNEGEGDDERYRRFCIGRHDAFAAAGWTKRQLPAASGVGMRDGSLTVYALAAAEAGVQVENPRQVSAYDYPRRYGPRSPSFARATVAMGLLMTAGTSSVVGHETAHRDDVEAQLDETLVNLEALARAAGASGLALFDRLKVYLRRRDDYPLVAARLERELPGAQTLYLQSDICRPDLLVEIEGVGAVSA